MIKMGFQFGKSMMGRHNLAQLKQKSKILLKAILPSHVYEKIATKSLRDILFNINWLIFQKALNILTGILIGAWIARYLGTQGYGMLSYAISFVTLFTCISTLGLNQIITRDIIKHPSQKNELLGTAFFLQLIGSLLLNLLASILIFLLRRENPSVRMYVAIVALGYIFKPFDVIDYWFQSQVQAKYAVISRIAALIITSIVRVILVLQRAPLVAFAWVFVVNLLLTAVGFLAFYHKMGTAVIDWDVKIRRARVLLKDSWPLILSGAAVAIHGQLDQVLLGDLLDEQAVGLYSAGKKLMQWSFIAVVVANSTMPALISIRKKDETRYYQRLQTLYDIMLWLAIGISVIVTLTSGLIVNFLYGAEYSQTAVVLSILTWSVAFNFYSIITAQHLITENLTKIQLYRTLIGAGVNVCLNALLIPMCGIIGASVSALLSIAVQGYFSTLIFRQTRRNFFMLLKSLNIYRIARELRIR
jgi:PST family polysaccharide transporter